MKKDYKIVIKDVDSGSIEILQMRDEKNNQEIGSLFFRCYSGKAWLGDIHINEEYMSRGYGDKLIKEFEKTCISKKLFWIEGKYYPTNDHAKSFYEKHGYEISKEDYDWFVTKRLSEGTRNLEDNLELLEDELKNLNKKPKLSKEKIKSLKKELELLKKELNGSFDSEYLKKRAKILERKLKFLEENPSCLEREPRLIERKLKLLEERLKRSNEENVCEK